MATEKEFKLIGSFQDNITAKLKKLNREINTINKSFQKMQSKLRPIARDMGTIAMASERVTKALKNQRTGYQSNINSMRSYRTEMGKTVAAAKKLSQIKPPRPMPMPRGGGGIPASAPSRRGGGGGLGFLGTTGAVALGNILTQSIISGFQSGVALMMKPLRWFGNAFTERMGDEMADIQSAGGLFATDKKAGSGLFKGFEDALSMQERMNKALAKSAAALPGATNDYVRTARQITDTVSMAFAKNKEDFKTLATSLGASATAGSEEQITKVLQKFTEKGVLLGQGQSGGIPLPILLEQLVSKQQVSVQGMKQRYVSLRDNPLLAQALEDAQDAINKTGAGTAQRIGEVIKALDAALPQEVVNKMRGSLEGLQESFRSAFMDPDTGLFGLSRELSILTPKVNEFGEYVTENGQVVKEARFAMQENTSVFKVLRETLAYFLVPLSELLDVLPQLFDPLTGIADAFTGLREKGRDLFQRFNEITGGITKYADDYSKRIEDSFKKGLITQEKRDKLMGDALKMRESARARGAVGALTEVLSAMGAIDPNLAKDIYKNVNDVSKELNLGDVVPTILKSLLNSKLVTVDIPEAIGKAIGSFVNSLAGLVEGVAKGAEEGNFLAKIIDSFFRAFNSAFGKTPEEIEARKTQIFKAIGDILGKAMVMLGQAVAKVGIPLAFKFVEGMFKGLEEMGTGGKLASAAIKLTALFLIIGKLAAVFGVIASVGATVAGWLGAVGPILASVGGAGGLLTGVLGTITAAILPAIAVIAALVGTGLALFALWRHGEFITSSLWESLKILQQGFLWVGDKLQEGISNLLAMLFQSVGNMLGPFGNQLKQMAADARVEAGRRKASASERAGRIQESANKIASNTQESFNRTKEDFAAIGNKINEVMGPKQETANVKLTEQAAIQTNLKANSDLLNTKTDKNNTTLDGVAKNTLQTVGKMDNVINGNSLIKTAIDGLSGWMKTGVMKVKMEGGMFPGLGAASAEAQAIGGTAARFGLTKTSGFRPGDPGWHGVGRAADFSNSTGPTKEMMAFAQYLSGTIGANLKELIYTPMGYGIKNGKRVPPYAKDSHYNHVHVAWNGGNTGPLLDEMRYAGNNTLGIANSGEFIANQNQTALLANALNKQNGHTFNISVNATGDGNEIANQVAAAVLNAVRQAENSTIS